MEMIGQLHAPTLLAPGTDLIGSSEGPRAGLKAVKIRSPIIAPAGN